MLLLPCSSWRVLPEDLRYFAWCLTFRGSWTSFFKISFVVLDCWKCHFDFQPHCAVFLKHSLSSFKKKKREVPRGKRSDSHSYILTSQVLINLEYPQCFQIDYILKYYTTFPIILGESIDLSQVIQIAIIPHFFNHLKSRCSAKPSVKIPYQCKLEDWKNWATKRKGSTFEEGIATCWGGISPKF